MSYNNDRGEIYGIIRVFTFCPYYEREAVKKVKEERKRMHKESVGSRLKNDKIRCAKKRKKKRKKKYIKTNS